MGDAAVTLDTPRAHQSPTAAAAHRPEPDHDRAAGAEPPAVRVQGLTKTYRHPWTLRVTPGLDDVSFEVRAGEIFGYLGPNGAGKTTTLKILTGLLKPTSGRAWLLGRDIRQVESRRPLGFLPEQPYFYDHLNGPEYLEMVARLSGLTGREARAAAVHWLGRVGLGDRARLGLRKYSKGMLQRLGLAAAMVHGPKLLILDEPMSGLDPFGRRDVRDLILEQRERGVTVMLSSHILPDVEALCDRVAIVLRGRLERIAPVGELVRGGTPRIELRLAGPPPVGWPEAFAGQVRLAGSGGDSVLTLHDPARLQPLLAWLVERGAEVRSVTPMRTSLEELFMAAAEDAALHASEQRRSA
jgi:ABC-2 type transport system ATP-binding protein